MYYIVQKDFIKPYKNKRSQIKYYTIIFFYFLKLQVVSLWKVLHDGR